MSSVGVGDPWARIGRLGRSRAQWRSGCDGPSGHDGKRVQFPCGMSTRGSHRSAALGLAQAGREMQVLEINGQGLEGNVSDCLESDTT